jgi:hypothetical protein
MSAILDKLRSDYIGKNGAFTEDEVTFLKNAWTRAKSWALDYCDQPVVETVTTVHVEGVASVYAGANVVSQTSAGAMIRLPFTTVPITVQAVLETVKYGDTPVDVVSRCAVVWNAGIRKLFSAQGFGGAHYDITVLAGYPETAIPANLENCLCEYVHSLWNESPYNQNENRFELSKTSVSIGGVRTESKEFSSKVKTWEGILDGYSHTVLG